MPPLLLLAVPAAAALAWVALRGGASGGRRGTGVGESFALDGALAPGETGAGAAGEEEAPFKREFLRAKRRRGGGEEDPETYGGEVGGPYGPQSQEQAPSAPQDAVVIVPPPTQTYTAVPYSPGAPPVYSPIGGPPPPPTYSPIGSPGPYTAPPPTVSGPFKVS